MYTLHWSPHSGAFAPHVALAEVGAECELIEVDLYGGGTRTPEFLAINPRGQVPVLTLPDGTVLTESVAMVMHLADVHPEAGLMPAPGTSERAQAYRWLLFSAVNLYETICRFVEPHHWTANESGFEGVKTKARDDLDRFWDMAGHAISGPYMLGQAFSAVDIFLLMMAYWHPDQAGLFERLPALKQLCDAARTRPAVESLWARYYS